MGDFSHRIARYVADQMTFDPAGRRALLKYPEQMQAVIDAVRGGK